MTFEDWTDVMYETMAVHPWSWFYYLTFIFLTAFAFLNMVIGIVVSALEREQNVAKQEEHAVPTMSDLHEEIIALRKVIDNMTKDSKG